MIRSAALSIRGGHRAAARPTTDVICRIEGGGGSMSSIRRLRRPQQIRHKRTGAHGGGGRKKKGGGGDGGNAPLSARDRAMGAADRARADRGAAPPAAADKGGSNRRSSRRGGVGGGGGEATASRSKRDVAGIWRGYNATTTVGVGPPSRSAFLSSAVDYSVPPPIVPSPPPPPPRAGVRRYMFPATIAVIGGLTAYVYVNNRNDAYEYWRAMQSGEAPPPDAFDEEDDEEDEEFVYDDDEEE